MFEFAARLFDSNGFTPRANCGTDWTPALMWMHIGGDLFIWLAYLSIPLMLLVFARRRELPYPKLFILFALFILSCGFLHLIEALMFVHPLYRLSGVWKVVTAVVSWITVIALVPVVSRVMASVSLDLPGSKDSPGLGDTTLHHLALNTDEDRTGDYLIAILASAMALLLRGAVDGLAGNDLIFVLPLLAVVFVSWQHGFGPAIVTLLITMFGMTYFFIEPRGSLLITSFGNQVALALFFFCGVCCAALGEAQMIAKRSTKAALALALEQKDAQRAEAARRETAEAGLRTTEATLRAFYDNSPLLMGIVELAGKDLWHLYDNRTSCNYFGVGPNGGTPRRATDIVASQEIVSLWLGKYQESARKNAFSEFEYQHTTATGQRWMSARVSPLPVELDGRQLFCYIAEDVTERVQAQETIRESEEKFRTLADSIPQLTWMTDVEGSITWYNKRWYEYTGTTFEQMKAWGWQSVQDPKELPRVVEKFKAHIASGEPWEDTFPLRRHDGRMRWHLSRATPIRDFSGKVVKWFGTNTDITDRLEMEQALRDSADRFRTLTEAVPQIVWTANPLGEPTFYNRRWDEITGSPMAVGGIDVWLRIIHPEDGKRFHAEWKKAVAEQPNRFSQEYRIRHATSGEYRWMLSTAVPLREPSGELVEWVGSITDIDDQKRYAENLQRMVSERTAELREEVEDRKQAEAEVSEQRQFLEAILANVADGIVACDEEGTLTLFNRAAKEFHGLTNQALNSQKWSEYYSLYGADGETLLCEDEIPLIRALNGETVRDFEFVIAPVDRPPRTVLASGQPLINEAGGKLGAVVSMRDISERKSSERKLREAAIELQRANLELARSNTELEQFAYIASHDLQEPLRKIQAFGDRLRTKFRDNLPEAGQEYVDRMQVSASRMRRLIDDLLTFSRVTTQTSPFVVVDLGKLINEVISDLSERIEPAEGKVNVGPMPVIDADPSQLRQLFQNLIANAVKFQRPGIPPVIDIKAEVVEEPLAQNPTELVEFCRITVRDNGIGFDEKYLGRILQVFQRLHGKEEYEGTGIGLAICRKIAERHGGAITARSKVGEGAAFIITLPVHHALDLSKSDETIA